MQRPFCRLTVLILLFCNIRLINSSVVTTLAKNDPAPLVNSSFPFTYLYNAEKDYLSGDTQVFEPNGVSISVSPFFQQADKGSNHNRDKITALGDISGRWNILALLPFGTFTSGGSTFTATNADLPTGYTMPSALTTISKDTLDCIDSVTKGAHNLTTIEGLLTLQSPTNENFGYPTVDLKYKKRGVRFSLAGMIAKGFGLSVQGGFSHISQSMKLTDQTAPAPTAAPADTPNPFAGDAQATDGGGSGTSTDPISDDDWAGIVSCVHRETMLNLTPVIADAIGLNMNDWSDSSIEDLRGEIFWRHAINLNKSRPDGEWPNCSIIPFFSVGYNLAIAQEQDPDILLSLPFGNNGHNALDFNAGISFDFHDSVELGMAGGGTIFYKDIKKSRVPNNSYQNVIYPFKADLDIDPGNTWFINAFINSRYFDDHLSLHADYMYVNHDKDKHALVKPDTVFKLAALEKNSAWNTQMVSCGLAYDISPGCSIGVKGQIAFGGENSYHSSGCSVSIELVN